MEFKIKAIRLREPSYVGQKLVSSVSLVNKMATGLVGNDTQKLELNFMSGVGVTIETDKDIALIPFQNIESIAIERTNPPKPITPPKKV